MFSATTLRCAYSILPHPKYYIWNMEPTVVHNALFVDDICKEDGKSGEGRVLVAYDIEIIGQI